MQLTIGLFYYQKSNLQKYIWLNYIRFSTPIFSITKKYVHTLQTYVLGGEIKILI